MRVVFFGTPDVAVPSLRALFESTHDVVAVVTQPDKPRGRSRSPSPSPVKQVAVEHDVPVLQPVSPKDEGFGSALRAHDPGALAVVAYGHILPQDVLAVAPAVNVHFSLLPRYRGAAPVQRALMDGATETGVSVFLLEPTVDTGPVLIVERIEIGSEETAGDVFGRLAPIGADALVRALDGIEHGATRPVEQDDALASKAPKIRAEETMIDWTQPAVRIVNLVRGLSPRPGAWTTYRGKRLGILRARVVTASGEPGVVVDEDALVVAAAKEGVQLLTVHPEGKRKISASEFVRGYRPSVGEGLGHRPLESSG